MKKIFIIVLFFLLCGIGNPVKALDSVDESLLYISADWLKKEVAQQPKKNIVFSSVSLYTVMAMLEDGATGETKEELEKFLDRSGYFLSSVGRGPFLPRSDEQVYFANSIWAKSAKNEFVSDIQKNFEAEVKDLPENTKEINDWISEKTNEKLKNVMPEGKIDDSRSVYLVNAIYFKAKWQSKFKRGDTREGDFYTLDGPIKTQIMYQRGIMDYFENETMQAIRLPYIIPSEKQTNGHNMYIFLPKKDVKWEDFIAHLTANDFYLDFIHNVSVELFLPKFDFEYQPDSFKQTLQEMGIKKAFDPSAELDKIREGSSVTDVVHKATITVDETGTEAAAVTILDSAGNAGWFRGMEREKPVFVFNADHPFVFMIDEGLFVGVVLNPEEK